MVSTKEYKFAVIGGGIIGQSMALALQKKYGDVLLISANKEGGATQASGGMISPAGEVGILDPKLLTDLISSLNDFPAYLDSLGVTNVYEKIDCHKQGTFFVASRADHLGELERLHHLQKEMGIVSEMLSRDGATQLEPGLSDNVIGGLYVRNEWCMAPYKLLDITSACFEEAGGQILQGEAKVDDSTEILCVTHADESEEIINAELVINCTGAWSMSFDNESFPERGQAMFLAGPSPIKCVVRSPDLYMVPRTGGIYIGASGEEVGFDASALVEHQYRLLDYALKLLPGLRDMAPANTMVGFRPGRRDGRPFIDWLGEKHLGVYGHFRHGIALVPWTVDKMMDKLSKRL